MNGGFLLDTNVPSDLMRPRPEPRVKDWMAAQNVGKWFLSVVSVGEFETGFATMKDPARRARLEASLERFLVLLSPRNIIPVTRAVAVRWGKLDGMRQMAGRPLNAADGMIAATALEHGLSVVTHNTKDFAGLGLTLIDPWNPA